MDELIGRLVSDIGVDRAGAETAVGIILDFLAKEGPADKIQLLLAKLPGAEALQQKAADAGGSGMGGVMGAGMAMMSAGLGGVMAGFPAIPMIPLLLALLLQQIARQLGINLVVYSQCGLVP